MDDERLLILTMLRDGKVTAAEAEKLLMALQSGSDRPSGARAPQPPRPPVAPQSPQGDGPTEIRRQAREIAHEVRRQARNAAQEARHAAQEAKAMAREARRTALEHVNRVKHEIRRTDFVRDEDVREIVDGISDGLREGMRGLRDGLDVGMREGMRGLREGMRGFDEAMRGVREGLGGPLGDRHETTEHHAEHTGNAGPGRFSWMPGSDRCEAREEFERSIDVPAGAGLDLSATNGDSKIVLWDEATVKVQGVKHAWGATDAEAKQRLGECDITSSVEGDWLVVRERLPQGRVFGRPSCVDFVVYVPRATAMKLKAVNGDLECREAVGRLDCRTINGDLSFGRISEADIGSTNGDITVDQASGSLSVSNVNGDITLGLLTVGGDSVTVRNVHGDIGCQFADGSTAAIEVSTRVGDVVTRREIQVEQRSGHRLVGRIGDGAGKVTLTTINGDVTIK